MSQLSDEINRFCRHTKFMIDELQSYIQSTNINSKNEFININNNIFIFIILLEDMYYLFFSFFDEITFIIFLILFYLILT